MPKTRKLEKNVVQPQKADGTARATMAGAVIAAIAASACCLVPAILAVGGISGLGIAAAFEPYRPLLLGITAALLAVGFYLVYRRPRAIASSTTGDADACGCPAPRTRRSGKAMLWIASAFVLAFAAYPYISSATATTSKRGSAVESVSSAQVTLRITGMTCAGCASSITKKLASVKGVVRASVSYENKTATAVYNPDQVSAAELAAAVSQLDGYSASVVGGRHNDGR